MQDFWTRASADSLPKSPLVIAYFMTVWADCQRQNGTADAIQRFPTCRVTMRECNG